VTNAVEKNSAIGPDTGEDIASDGELSSDAYDVAKRTLEGDSKKIKSSRKQYNLNRVHIETEITYNIKTGDDTGSVGYAYKGIDPKVLLSGVEFYQHVERNDLESRYKGRQRLRQSLMWGGGLLAIASPIVATTALTLLANSKDDPAEEANASDKRFAQIAGIGAATGIVTGIVLWFIGKKTSKRILNVGDKGQVAREYNAMLRRRLGLTESDVSRKQNDTTSTIENNQTYAGAYDHLKAKRKQRKQERAIHIAVAAELLPRFSGIKAQLSF